MSLATQRPTCWRFQCLNSTCQHCGETFEVTASTSHCPHCDQAIVDDVQSTVVSSDSQPKLDDDDADPNIISSVDSAKTAMAGPDQVPDQSIEELIGGSSRTIDSAGQSPNIAGFSSTLKPTDSVFESADLSSAIPPRTIVTKDAKPGEAQDYRLGKKLGSGSFGVVYRAAAARSRSQNAQAERYLPKRPIGGLTGSR